MHEDDPRTDAAGRKETNPLIWGGVVALFAALVSVGASLSSEPVTNTLLANPATAAAGGFFWGWVAGLFKRWLGRRDARPRR